MGWSGRYRQERPGACAAIAGPLPVRAVQAGRVGAAAAVAVAAAGAPFGDRAGQHHAGPGDGRHLGGYLLGLGLVAGGDTHGFRVAWVRDPGHVILYIYSMSRRQTAGPPAPEAAGYIASWRPSSVSPQAASFARAVVGAAGPPGRERA